MKNLRVVLTIAALTASQITASSQTAQLLDKTAKEIKAKNKRVTLDLLQRDLTVIKSISPRVQHDLQAKGFSPQDSSEAIRAAWKELRKPSADLSPLDESRLSTSARQLGRIEIKSTPTGADITVDTEATDTKTDAAQWMQVGKRAIRLTKDGYLPEEEVRDIKEGSNPTLSKVLKRKK